MNIKEIENIVDRELRIYFAKHKPGNLSSPNDCCHPNSTSFLQEIVKCFKNRKENKRATTSFILYSNLEYHLIKYLNTLETHEIIPLYLLINMINFERLISNFFTILYIDFDEDGYLVNV